jgi:hypothetical protein
MFTTFAKFSPELYFILSHFCLGHHVPGTDVGRSARQCQIKVETAGGQLPEGKSKFEL